MGFLCGKQKTRGRLRKALSIMLSAVMVAGSMSIGGVGISTVKGETGESGEWGVVDPTKLTAPPLDGTSINGVIFNNNSNNGWKLATTGGVQVLQTQSSDNDLQFTIPDGKSAVVTYTISATGKNNEAIVKLKKDEKEISNVSVKGDGKKTPTLEVNIEDVEAGTYTLKGEKPEKTEMTASANYRLYDLKIKLSESDSIPELTAPSVTVKPSDGKLSVSWKKVSSADRYRLTVKNGDSVVIDNEEIVSSDAVITKEITGLTNGTEYICTVTAVRDSDSSEKTSEHVKGTPITVSSGYRYINIDVSGDLNQGLKKGIIYGDAAVATVEVLQDMAFKASDVATIDGVQFTGVVQGSLSPSVQGDIPVDNTAAFKIETVRDAKITFVTKKAPGKSYWFIDSDKNEVKKGSSVEEAFNEFEIEAGKTYYYYAKGSKLSVYAIYISAGTPDVDWNSIAAPSLTVKQSVGKTDIDIDYAAAISSEETGTAAEYLEVEVYKGDSVSDSPVAELKSRAVGTSGKLSYSPDESGRYTFKPILKRIGMEDKAGEAVKCDYVLPIAVPEITATSQGNGVIRVEWKEVSEATGYEVYVDGSLKGSTQDTYMDCSGLNVGQEYTFKVRALRGETAGEFSEEVKETATGAAKIKWELSVFGNGTNSANATIDNSAAEDLGNDTTSKVRLIAGKKDSQGYFVGNCGKLQAQGDDGLVFYYTAVPVNMNFTLNATAHVNSWRYSNGQEGFGLMAADKVFSGTGNYWYNSYMADVAKVEYYYDSDNNKVSDNGDKISMKLGVGAQEKLGVTKANQSSFQAKDIMYTMSTLDTSCAKLGAGTYNLVANVEKQEQIAGYISSPDITADFNLSIQKNNTGYFISYTDKNGVKTTKKFYTPDALNKQDSEYVYVGFFASRYADVTFGDVSFTTIEAVSDAPTEERPIEYVTPKCSVISEKTANSAGYNFIYYANADGKLTVKDSNNVTIIDNADIKSGVKYEKQLELVKGDNVYNVTFEPDHDYRPDNSEYKRLSSYDTINEIFNVKFESFTGEDGKLYVSPSGSSSGDGTQAKPLDIYTAVKYVTAGQTIILKEGRYNLTATVVIPRGTDGTAAEKISLIADPEASSRPVLDFGGKCAGMIFAGNYWCVKGFDVTNSGNGQKGIQVSGSYSKFELINTYYNGNTGLQVSRYLSSDSFDLWPSYDTILNCSSYCNADSGYEDADGFAAKLTVGNGIVFDGCISHHNADDGWDLFAKNATGSIGAVTIKNSVAYANGYWINRSGNIVDAGNGNGFKMGGDSLSGKHTLVNSVSYDNKAKGIDSNSCPDIRVMNCTSYNNGSYNVALYTNSASNTDFEVTGLASFRKGTNVKEQLSFKGSQDESKVYKSVNYYWDAATNVSKNSDGEQCTDAWFASTNTKIVPTRFADGSINMNGLLVRTPDAKQGAMINPVMNKIEDSKSDSGNSGGGSNSGNNSSSGSSEDFNSSSSDSNNNSSDDNNTTGTNNSSSDNVSAGNDNVTSTIQGTDFVANDGINSSAAGIIADAEADGIVKENVDVAMDNQTLNTNIADKIDNSAQSEIVVYASENTVLEASVIKSLADSGKSLSIAVVDDEGKLAGVITIDGSKITGEITDFNLKVETGINAGNNAANIVKVASGYGIASDSIDIVDFKYSGNLPGTFKTTIRVNNRYADGTKLALFYYNPATGELENQYQITTVVDGYAEFSINHCSSYVLIEEAALNTMITKSALASPKTADSNYLIVLLFIMSIAVMVFFGADALRKEGER